jgi:hypothetical protein
MLAKVAELLDDWAPGKNGPLLTEYLAKGASERFLKLATKYRVDLERFL